jgi:arylformamidase
MARSFELIDVCHSIEDGMITYAGLPAPVITDHLSREASREKYAPGTEFHIGKIEMVANTGTYLDTPFHRYARGRDLAGLDLYSVANLEGLVVRVTGKEIDADFLSGFDVKEKAVLLHTGWDKHWRTDEYFSGNHPFVTADGAEYLAKSGAALVGIDSYNIDATTDAARPAHSIILGHDIPIVEHLCGLSDLPDTGFKFFAVPIKIKRFGTFPVRAFGLVE